MKKTPVSLGVAAASAAIARAAASIPHDELIRRVRTSLELALGTLGHTHQLVIDDVKEPDGKVVGVTLLGRMPVCQLVYVPHLSTGDAVFHTFPLTDAVLVAALVNIAGDALASIPGNPVQIQVGPPMAARFEELPGGGTGIKFTMDYNEILDICVETADQLPETFRNIRTKVQAANAKPELIGEVQEAQEAPALATAAEAQPA